MFRQFLKWLPSGMWTGAFAGMAAVIFGVSILASLFFPSGLPLVINLLVGVVTGSLLLYVLVQIYFFVQGGLRRLPLSIVSMFFAGATALYILNLTLRIPEYIFNVSGLVVLVMFAFLGGVAGMLLQNSIPQLSMFRKSAIIAGLVLSLFILGWSAFWLASKGDVDINEWESKLVKAANGVPAIDADDPSASGKFRVKTFFYGSGKDKRRQEFGKNVNLITSTVDASLLLPEWKDFKKKMREWYWGFGVKDFPINARVWYPEGPGPFPLVLIVHGNHGMEEYSDPGYAYLGELMASRGFIFVSVDENFVNATWSGDFVGKEMQVRGWLLLEHLRQWREWNHAKDNLFFDKVDMDRIALIGHSRGGEAIAIAAAFNHLPFYPDQSEVKFDYHFNIRSLISIAPTDRRYTRRMQLSNINYLTLQGGLDADESSFFGMRQAERITYTRTDTSHYIKAGLYTPGANHGQFNSVWKTDVGLPYRWFLNSKPLIAEKDQQKIAKVYVSGFLESTLLGKRAYLPIFEHWAYAKKWLPDLPYLNRFEDNRTTILAGYEEDIDLTTASQKNALIKTDGLALWKEAELFYRDGKDKQNNSAVILGWRDNGDSKRKPYYAINFEKLVSLSPADHIVLSFSAGDHGELRKAEDKATQKKDEKAQKEMPPDLSIVLMDSVGTESSIPLQELIDVHPRWQIQYLKVKNLSTERHGSAWEPTLGDYQLPLKCFLTKAPKLNVSALKKIEFRFDRSPTGVVLLDKIGYRKN